MTLFAPIINKNSKNKNLKKANIKFIIFNYFYYI